MSVVVKCIVILSCLAVAPARPAGAQTVAPPGPALSLTLEEAIARGVASAPRLAEARAREAAAASTAKSRAAAAAPSVAVTSGFLRTNHVEAFSVPLPGGGSRVLFPDIPDNYQARAEVDVPVYTSGRVGAQVRAARSDERATAADGRVTEQDLRLQIAAAYWSLVTGRESVRVLDAAQVRMEAYVGDVKSRLDAGFLAPNDVLTAQSQRARQTVQLIQARNAAASAEADLDRLIGAAPGQAIDPITPVTEATPGSADVTGLSVDALVNRAETGRAEREAVRDRQDVLAATGAAALAALRPSIGGYAAVQPARPNQLFVPRTDTWRTSWSLGVNVNWSLFDGGRARADAAAAASQSLALSRHLDDFDATLQTEIRQRLLDLDSGRAAIAASAEAVAAATEAHRVLQARFNAGVATSTDVLDAQLALREAELEQTRLLAALRLSEARLLRALGAL